MSIILRNGMLLTESGELGKKDIYIENGKIAEIAETISRDADQVVDAKGRLIAPGFIDLHVHLREPGGEHKETIATGTMAAARGGFTTVAAMPNTRPVPDTKEQLEWLNKRIEETAAVRVLPYASITVRELGEELTNFAELKEAGAFAFTDDGVGVQSAGMMLEAMKTAAKLNMAIVAHCEDNTLINGGCVHEGSFSRKYGLKGIPSVCESVHIARDVFLAEAAGCHYHVCHISTEGSVRAVRDAKKAGIKVTAEVTPHHLLLTDEDIPGPDPNYKMNPPLRGERTAGVNRRTPGWNDRFYCHGSRPAYGRRKSKRNGACSIRNCRIGNCISTFVYTFCRKRNFDIKAACRFSDCETG